MLGGGSVHIPIADGAFPALLCGDNAAWHNNRCFADGKYPAEVQFVPAQFYHRLGNTHTDILHQHRPTYAWNTMVLLARSGEECDARIIGVCGLPFHRICPEPYKAQGHNRYAQAHPRNNFGSLHGGNNINYQKLLTYQMSDTGAFLLKVGCAVVCGGLILFFLISGMQYVPVGYLLADNPDAGADNIIKLSKR